MVFNMDGWSVAYCIQYEMVSRGIAISTCTCNSVRKNNAALTFVQCKVRMGNGQCAFSDVYDFI